MKKPSMCASTHTHRFHSSTFHHLFLLVILFSLISANKVYSQTDVNYEIQFEKSNNFYKEDGKFQRTIDDAVIRLVSTSIPTQGDSPKAAVENYFSENAALYGLENGLFENLELIFELALNSGHVLTYAQTYKGLPVFGSELFVKLDKNNNIRKLSNSTFPINDFKIPENVFSVDAKSKVADHLDEIDDVEFTEEKLGLIVINDAPQVVWKLNCSSSKIDIAFQAIVNAETNTVLSVEKTTDNATGTGNVFNPTPTYSAQQPFGTGGFVLNGDMNNADLTAQLMNVQLNDITFRDGYYRLEGPYAHIEDPDDIYKQSSTDYSYDRSHDFFEAVMCYYHVDRSMRYVNEELGVSIMPKPYMNSGVRINPKVKNDRGANFNKATGKISMGDGNGEFVNIAEDATAILHELGHAIHNWAGPHANNSHCKVEGTAEGMADYWGQSENRDCRIIDDYPEWNELYHRVFHWAFPDPLIARTTNFTSRHYSEELPGTWEPSKSHRNGQFLSTPLMRIRNDIGKLKADKLFVEAAVVLRAWLDPNSSASEIKSLQEAGFHIYDVAADLVVSNDLDEKDLCIIHHHMVDLLTIDENEFYTGPPATISRDYFIRDSECDMGVETNDVSDYIWQSDDIWVRNSQDGELEHQNPIYQGSQPNYVYVRIRGRGCDIVANTKLHLYFNRGSSSPQWPTSWENYYRYYPKDGLILDGDEITTAAGFSIPYIAPGEELIVSFPWQIPAGPVFTIPEVLHFNFLARLVTTSDPMHISESNSTLINATNNNNVAWKNISIMNQKTPLVSEVSSTILLGPDFGPNSTLSIKEGNCYLNTTMSQLGTIYLELDDDTHDAWLLSGQQGQSFDLMPDGRIKVLNENFELTSFYTANDVAYVTFYYNPINENKNTSFNIIFNNSVDNINGGHTFLFRGLEPPVQGKLAKKNHKFETSNGIKTYPNPVSDKLIIEYNVPLTIRQITVHRVDGTKCLEQNFDDQVQQLNNVIDVNNLSPGVYLLRVNALESQSTKKFVKY